MPRHLLLILCALATFCSRAQQPELKIHSGHSAWITHFAVSPDETYLATASYDETVKIWDFRSKKELRTLKGHKATVEQVAFSPDNKRLASGDSYGNILIWDVESGKRLDSFKYHYWVITSLAFSSDGFQLASCSIDSTLSLVDLKTGKEKTYINLGSRGVKVQFMPGDQQLVFASSDSLFTRWDIKGDSSLEAFWYSHGDIKDFALSKDGRILYTAVNTDTSNIRTYDMQQWNTIKRLHGHTNRPAAITLGKDENTFYSSAYYYRPGIDSPFLEIKKWNTLAGTCIDSFTIKISPRQSAELIYSARSNRLLTSSSSVGLVSFGVQPLALAGYIKGGSRLINEVFEPRPNVLVLFGDDGPLKEWNIKENRFSLLSARVSTHGISQSTLLRDSARLILLPVSDSAILLYNLKHKTTERILSHQYNIRKMGLSEDQSYLAFGAVQSVNGFYQDTGEVVLRQWAAAKTLARRPLSTGFVMDVAVLPDNHTVAYVTDQNVINLWHTQEEACDHVLKDSALKSFTSEMVPLDSTRLLTADFKGNLFVWDWNSRRLDTHWVAHNQSLIHELTLSADKTRLLTCSDDKLLKLWDTRTFQLLQTFAGHQSWVTEAGFLSNGSQVYSSGPDNTLRIWDIASGREVASLITVDTSEVITRLPNNYYTATRHATKFLSFQIGNQLYPFEQFDLQYNRPHEVLKQLGNRDTALLNVYRAAYAKRLKRAGFTESDFSSDLHLPEVALLNSANLPTVTTGASLPLSFRASDSKYHLDRFYISINNVPLNGTNGTSVRQRRTRSYRHSDTLTLTAGVNKISISCMNEKGVESLRQEVYVTYQPPQAPSPTLYFIGIGVSRFRDAGMNLTYADKDTRDLVALFRSKYPGSRIDTFVNEGATREAVLAVKEKLKRTSEEDIVVISVSSHGLLDKSLDYYIATHDMDFKDPTARGLRYEDLEGLLDDIPARKKLLLIDACHSGEVDKEEALAATATNPAADTLTLTETAFTRGAVPLARSANIGLQNSFELMKQLFADVARTNGAMVISAAGGKEYALEDARWSNGVFTYCLKKGLLEGLADTNGDGISINELKTYISDHVERLTKGRQRPTTRKENIEFDWKLW